ncbi:MAG: hypothetical protein LBM98_08970 [Oscillospiraceae bacterium]|jgi:hypothetical protein|nr:hypothetical protein [Oscillospiraceae bacterium]
MRRGSKIKTFLLFFSLVCETLYLFADVYFNALVLRLIARPNAGDALIAAAIAAGIYLFSYIFYYAVCYRRGKSLPVLLESFLLFTLSFELLLTGVYQVFFPLWERGIIALPDGELFTLVAALPVIMAAVVYIIALAYIGGVVGGIRKIRRTIYAAIAKKEYAPSYITSGSELQALSSEVNELTEAALNVDSAAKRRSEAYLRFIPERFLSLIGLGDIEEITRSMTASREMAVMSVLYGLTFGDDSDAGLIFDRVNAVTGRVSGVVSNNGGTMFNYNYNGFEAVFDSATAAVKSAVAIQRDFYSRAGSYSKIRVGIDYGLVLLGVVGDERRQTPTIVSAAADNSRELSQTAKLLNVGILCGEAVANLAEGYNSRYIGKRGDKPGPARVYEFYDGAPPALSEQFKRLTADFNRGILLFYSANYSAAKRVFLDIVKQCPEDSVNRYYLYKTDKFERNPPATDFAIGDDE